MCNGSLKKTYRLLGVVREHNFWIIDQSNGQQILVNQYVLMLMNAWFLTRKHFMICFWILKLSTPSAVFEASFFAVGELKWGDSW
jgi:hypothetical protein